MSADELLLRLEELRAELRVRDRPERRAWTSLEPTKNGWTTRPYDDRAFGLWKEVERRFPSDLHTVHHLAIMHHARAIDTEQSDHPGESDADWRQALAYWHRLFQAGEFWAELSERVDATPDPVPQIREDIAERLLRMHFDIALDEQSPHHRSRFHVRLALDSPFPGDLVERVRLQAYERAIGGLDAAVWRPDTIDAEVLRPAIDAVTGYLERDEGCAVALRDLLGLLNRAGTGHVNQANGVGDTGDIRDTVDEIRATARHYDGYITRVERLLLKAAEPDELALSDLALWHSRAGQAYQLTNAYEEAAGFYERALRAARAGADPRAAELRAEWLLSTVLAAREHATDDGKRARRLLSTVEKSDRLPGLVLLIRAQARAQLDDLDDADRDAKDALAAFDSPQDDVHGPWYDDVAKMRDECQKLRDQIREARLAQKITPHMEKAEKAAKSSRWGEAVAELDVVLEIDGDFVPALVRRAECRLGQYETAAAGKDLDRAEQLSRAAQDKQALTLIRELRDILGSMHKQVTTYGGPKAFQFQQKATEAFNAGRYDEAIELIRKCRSVARPVGSKKIDEVLAHFLNAAACKLVKPIAQQFQDGTLPSSDPLLDLLSPRERSSDDSVRDLLSSARFLSSGRAFPTRFSNALATVRRAEKMLTEAASLDRTPTISQNLSQVTLLRRRLEEGGLW